MFKLVTSIVPVFLFLGSTYALKHGGYWSAFAFPNVPPTQRSGGGDASTMDSVNLFSVDMALTNQPGHADPRNPTGQFYKFADTYDTSTTTSAIQGTFQGAAPFGGVQPVAAPPSGAPSATVGSNGKTHADTIRQLLKPASPSTLAVICVFGGWTMDDGFAGIASDPTKAKNTAKEMTRFAITNDYDGLDIDWEYPGSKGSSPEVYAGFLATIKAAMKDEANNPKGKKLTLSIAVPARGTDLTAVMPDPAAKASDLATMIEAVDIFNAMAYDNTNGDDSKSGPFTGGGVAHDLVTTLTGKYGIGKDKINVGWACFTRQWPLKSTDITASCGSDKPKINECNVQGLDGYTGMAVPNMTCDFPMNEPDATVNQGSDPGWKDLWQSWVRASAPGAPISNGNGASFFIDPKLVLGNRLFWSFATADDIKNTQYGCPKINDDFSGLYGHFVFSLNEDAAGSPVINEVAKCAGKAPAKQKRSISRKFRLN